MRYKESDQPLKQLKQVVSPSNPSINRVFEQFPILLHFGEPVRSKAAPPQPAAKPEPPLPGTLAPRRGRRAAGRQTPNPELRRGGTCPPTPAVPSSALPGARGAAGADSGRATIGINHRTLSLPSRQV